MRKFLRLLACLALINFGADAQSVMPPFVQGGVPTACGASGTNFAQDTFAGTGGTHLQAHTDNLGNAWTQLDTTGTFLNLTGGGALNSSTGGGNQQIYNDAATPTCADYSVLATLTLNTSVAAGPTCRSTDKNNRYQGIWNGFSSQWMIQKIVAGVTTTIGTPVAGTASGSQAMTFTCSGSNFTLSIPGQSVTVTATDGSLTAAGKAGVTAINYTVQTISAFSAKY